MTYHTASDSSAPVSKGSGWGITLALLIVGVVLFAAVMLGLVSLLGSDDEVDGTSGGVPRSMGAAASSVHS